MNAAGIVSFNNNSLNSSSIEWFFDDGSDTSMKKILHINLILMELMMLC